MTNNSG